MKPHPDLTIAALLAEMKTAAREERPRRVDGGPESDADRAEAQAALIRIIDAGGVNFFCVGCDEGMTPDEATICVCGGFVCPACRRTETEGECTHEVPQYPGTDDEHDPDV